MSFESMSTAKNAESQNDRANDQIISKGRFTNFMKMTPAAGSGRDNLSSLPTPQPKPSFEGILFRQGRTPCNIESKNGDDEDEAEVRERDDEIDVSTCSMRSKGICPKKKRN
jgi:hypothetical protein